MNVDVLNKVIRRFSAAYGPPQVEEPAELFEEFSKALAGTRGDLLTKGVDTVIKERVFPGWPTVGEVVKACRDAADELASNFSRPQPVYPKNAPVHPTIAKALLEGFNKAMHSGNAFADINARASAWGRYHNCKVTIDVSKTWGEEVVDEFGRIVPIRWKMGDAA